MSNDNEDTADRFFLTIKNERLERAKLDKGLKHEHLPDTDIQAGIVQFKREWNNARTRMLVEANSYLANNINAHGRDYDKFADPELLQKTKAVETQLREKIGVAPDNAAARLAALNVVAREGLKQEPKNPVDAKAHFDVIATDLNKAVRGGNANASEGPFDAGAARNFVRAVGRFQATLLNEVGTSPKANSATWLDDFDTVKDPRYGMRNTSSHDRDRRDQGAAAKPLFRPGRPAEQVERFPEGMTFGELRQELDRVRGMIKNGVPACGAEGADDYYLDLPDESSPRGREVDFGEGANAPASHRQTRERSREGREL